MIFVDYGEGVLQGRVEAAVWLRKAADWGNTEAEYNVRLLYDDGQRVSQDTGKAKDWYRKAAEQCQNACENRFGPNAVPFIEASCRAKCRSQTTR